MEQMQWYEKWSKKLDELDAEVEKRKKEGKKAVDELAVISSLSERAFDFEKLAFERLKNKIGDSKISVKDYYQLNGRAYSFKKAESRQLLKALMKRFPVRMDSKGVWIE